MEKIDKLTTEKPTGISRRKFVKGLIASAILTAIPQNIFSQIDKFRDKEWLEIKDSVDKLETKFGLKRNEFAIVVNPRLQKLYVVFDRKIVKKYPISTATNGIGNTRGSKKTPPGTHRIVEKIGKDAPIGEIFKHKKDTGKKAKIFKDKTDAPKDFVLTRIISLRGEETGINKGKGIDSYFRGIYIHGTNEEGLIGEPHSHGCIRMKNDDVVELFDLVPLKTLVEIQNKSFEKH